MVAGEAVGGGGVSSMTMTSLSLPSWSTSWTSEYETEYWWTRLRLRVEREGVERPDEGGGGGFVAGGHEGGDLAEDLGRGHLLGGAGGEV